MSGHDVPPWARPLSDWPEGPARDAEIARRPARDAEWAEIVAEEGDNLQVCLYCGLETRPFSEWAAGAECTRCHGTMYEPPPL